MSRDYNTREAVTDKTRDTLVTTLLVFCTRVDKNKEGKMEKIAFPLNQKSFLEDIRGDVKSYHPCTRNIYSDPNWCEGLLIRNQLSNWKMVDGTVPPMTEREQARFKGWW